MGPCILFEGQDVQPTREEEGTKLKAGRFLLVGPRFLNEMENCRREVL